MPGPAFGYGMLAVEWAATAHSTSGLWIDLLALDREGGVRWQVMVELGGVEGTVQLHEVSSGGCRTAEYSLWRATSAQGLRAPTTDVLVWRRGRSFPAFRTQPMWRGVAPDHRPGRGNHARPLHAEL